MPREQVFIPISNNCPIEVAINPFLSNTEKQLFGWISNLCKGEAGCWASNSYLGMLIGRCEQTISNSISSLQKYRYLRAHVFRAHNSDGTFITMRTIAIDYSFYDRYAEMVSFFFRHDMEMEESELIRQTKDKIEEAIAIDQPTNKKFIVGENQAPADYKEVYSKDILINTIPILKPINTSKDISIHFNTDNTSAASQHELPPSIDPLIIGDSEKPIEKKIQRRPGMSSAHVLAATANAEMIAHAQRQQEEVASARKQHPKENPFQNIPRPLEEAMEHWASLGFSLPDPNKAPKGYNDTIRALKTIQTGKLIPRENRQFSLEDVKDMMTRFSLMAFDNFGNYSEEMRCYFAKMSLKNFLYSPDFTNPLYRKYEKTTSWFIKCYEMPSLERQSDPVKIEMLEDQHPEVKNRIISFYRKYALAGIKQKLSISEENKFRIASNEICKMYNHFQNRGSMVGVNGYGEMADVLCMAVKDFYGEKTTKVIPGSFCSSFIMSRTIAYMTEKGYLPNTDFEM